ncbi:MAG: GDCCVxC domain-containing (seleno)protein [Candidatus Poseidoniaceae archaeon]|nr:GDCCVxC domain-containing (seleno)protein [Candidatus Poseidoniaceae archaeon]
MPINACLAFVPCPQCAEILRPRTGDCCVPCSYGDNKCPPIQVDGDCC